MWPGIFIVRFHVLKERLHVTWNFHCEISCSQWTFTCDLEFSLWNFMFSINVYMWPRFFITRFHVLKEGLHVTWNFHCEISCSDDGVYEDDSLLYIPPSNLFITLMTEAVRTSETSVYFNETTRLCMTEGWRLKFSLFQINKIFVEIFSYRVFAKRLYSLTTAVGLFDADVPIICRGKVSLCGRHAALYNTYVNFWNK
jgi:hypothetical protein